MLPRVVLHISPFRSRSLLFYRTATDSVLRSSCLQFDLDPEQSSYLQRSRRYTWTLPRKSKEDTEDLGR